MKFKNTDRLCADIYMKRKHWNEHSSFTLKGIGNLSQSDLETLILYCEVYNKYGHFNDLMPPRGDIAKVLEAYDIREVV